MWRRLQYIYIWRRLQCYTHTHTHTHTLSRLQFMFLNAGWGTKPLSHLLYMHSGVPHVYVFFFLVHFLLCVRHTSSPCILLIFPSFFLSFSAHFFTIYPRQSKYPVGRHGISFSFILFFAVLLHTEYVYSHVGYIPFILFFFPICSKLLHHVSSSSTTSFSSSADAPLAGS